MINLLEETLKDMEDLGKTVLDVSWIGSSSGEFIGDWDRFRLLADIGYHNGYGHNEIVSNLVIVFKDKSWLERYEYDGSECWVYKEIPKKQKKAVLFNKIINDDYEDKVS